MSWLLAFVFILVLAGMTYGKVVFSWILLGGLGLLVVVVFSIWGAFSYFRKGS